MASGISVLGFPGLNLVDTNAFQYGPKGDLAPETALAEQGLNRKQQIANLLIQRALAPLPAGQMAGRFFVPTSPWQGGAQLASALAGLLGTHYIDSERKDLAKQDADMVTKALEAYRQKTGPQAVEGDAYGPGAPVANTVSYNMQNMPDPSLTPSGTWDIDKLQPDTSPQVQANKNRLALALTPQGQAPQAEAPLAGVPQEMNPWTMELLGKANQPPAGPPPAPPQPDPLAAAFDQGQHYTRQPFSQPYSEITMNAPTTEGQRPTATTYEAASPEAKRQALIELMANQHPRVAGMAKLLAQQEQQERQLEMQQQQQLLLKQIEAQNALMLKGTPSADSQAEIAARKELHAQPSGNAKLQARDQLVTTGPNGEIIPNQPVIDAKTKIAEAGAAKTQVAVNTQLPASDEAQKEYMKGARATYDQLKMAPQALENIEKAKALIPQAKGFMGPGGESMLEAAKFLNNRLGTSINTEGIKSAEELRSRIFFNIMENLKKMDAQPSEMQQRIMMESLGKLGTDPNALPAVLDAYADAIRGKVEAYNTDVSGAEQRGVKFPYNPVIKIPERASQGKSVVRTGKTKDGKKVVEYSDGSVEYAQ